MLNESARTMASRIRRREISSRDLVAAHLQQITRINPLLNAVVAVFAEEALQSAEEADCAVAAGATLGPLHGVPFSVKDSIDVRGHRTTAGTLGFQERPAADEDATVVARLRQAGAIPIAKTNLPDLLFAFESDNLIFGRTNNPYDLDRTPGGSSGGEAALLAACGSPLGLGSDAAGSVRLPAAFCGVASIKPTGGRLPRTGHLPEAGGWVEALWAVGPMARYVEDLEIAMAILTGADGRDWSAPPVPFSERESNGSWRVAVFADNGFARCASDVKNAVARAADVLTQAGHRVEHCRPPCVEEAFDLEMDLLGAEGSDGIDSYLQAIGSHQQHALLHVGFLDRMRGRRCSPNKFAELWARWDGYRSRMAQFFAEFDAVVCPVYTEAALPHGESATPDRFEGFSYTMAWNLSGQPAAVVRCGSSGELPVNVQVITPRWQDRRALQICRLLEQQLGGWSAPALFQAHSLRP